MPDLTLQDAQRIAKAVIDHARAAAMNPLSIAVIDAGGHVKCALREDGAGISGVDIALGKARAALSFGCSSRQIADALAGNPLAGPSVLSVLQGRVVLLAGGVLLHDGEGKTVGAVAAAGDAPDNDEAAAMAGAGA